MTIKFSEMTAASALTGAEILPISVLSTTVTKTATTISALASDNSFNDSGNGLIIAGFAVGDQVKLIFTGSAPNTIHSAKITALTAGKMTFGGTDGDVIVDAAAGPSVTITKWLTRRTTAEEVAALSGAIPTIYTKTASYSAVSADANNVFEMNVGSANDFTVPANADEPMDVGSFLEVWQKGAGQTTIVADAGVTILYDDHLTLSLLGQDAGVTLRKVATDTWRLIGLMEPAAALEADAIEFDNTTSGMTATDVQGALDEIAATLTAGAGYAEGSSNPGSPSTGDKFYRTDLNLLIFYDGTRWLTVEQFKADFTLTNISATGASGYVHVRQDFAVYMEDFLGSALANGTNDGSNYWNVTLQWVNAANTATTLATLTTSAGAGTTWLPLSSTLDAALSGSAITLRINATKVLSAGNLFAGFMLTYRLIIT